MLAATHELFTFRHGLDARAWRSPVLGRWFGVYQAVIDCSTGGMDASRLQEVPYQF